MAEFLINTHTAGFQTNPSVTALAAGGFVATWVSDQQGGTGIYGQRYDAAGVAAGSEFRIDSQFDQIQPSVTALAGGGFVATWTSRNQDGSFDGIYGQRYDAAGGALDGEFLINTHTANVQTDPQVTGLSDGGFVATWTSASQDGSGDGVYGQRYDAAGAAAGSEFRINTQTDGQQRWPSVTALSGGGFVATWGSYDYETGNENVYGRRYDAAGAPAGSEFRISDTAGAVLPSVTGLSGGGFVATWEFFDQDLDDTNIYGQRYDAAGFAAGSEFRINSSTANDQTGPSVTGLSDGGFVATWTSASQDGSGDGVYGQRYDASGAAVGSEFRVNTHTVDYQGGPSVSGLPDGGFVVTWTSAGQDGSSYGIYGQRYDANGVPVSSDIITGTGGPDSLDGTAGNDVIHGLGGNDTIDGHAGADQMSGGPGDDYYVVDNAGDQVVEAPGEGTDIVASSVTHTLAQNVEHLQLTGASPIDGTGNELANGINGNEAANTLSGEGDNDSLDGKGGNDTLAGGSGNDFFYGGAGTDQMSGEAGDDLYLTDGTGDSVIEAAGEGTDIVASVADETLETNVEHMVLLGSDNIDGTGNELANYIGGNEGDNTLSGLDGDDILDGTAGNDSLVGGEGIDVLIGGEGNDTLTGNGGIDLFMVNPGTTGADTVTDFQDGEDYIYLPGVVVDNPWITQNVSDQAAGARIQTGLDSTIDLVGVYSASISSADFV